jgi:hypothetical protein
MTWTIPARDRARQICSFSQLHIQLPAHGFQDFLNMRNIRSLRHQTVLRNEKAPLTFGMLRVYAHHPASD